MKLAAEHAHRMASMDKMSHSLPGEGSFAQRIAAGGFQASMAAENVAAGQKSLAEVFEAWRKSPGHNANMLLPNVSLMGIALAIQPGGRYHTYWSLELGERYVPPAGGPMARPGTRPGHHDRRPLGGSAVSRAGRATGGHWRAQRVPPAPPPARSHEQRAAAGRPEHEGGDAPPLRPQPVDHRMIGRGAGIDERHRRSGTDAAGASSMSCTPGE